MEGQFMNEKRWCVEVAAAVHASATKELEKNMSS